MAIYSACNRQDEAALRKISTMVADCQQCGELWPTEAKWFSSIIDLGLAGDWTDASREIRQLMNEQVDRAKCLSET